MVIVDPNSSDNEVIGVVLEWVDVLARKDYLTVFKELGYWDYDEESGVEEIRNAISKYRSPEFFPGVEEFVVSDWRLAKGGNPEPQRKVVWYDPNEPGIRASISVDLPLNGAWSDLQAEFLLFERAHIDSGYELRLETIYSWKQRNRESDEKS
jgi:hypothetical protein